MPVLKYREYVGAPWQVVGVTSAGLLPQIIVSAPSGSTVTCTKGSIMLNAEEVDDTWTFDVPQYGEWTITSTVYGVTETQIVNVNSVKQYRMSGVMQRVNYAMLYDAGDECKDLTGGWYEEKTNNGQSYTDKQETQIRFYAQHGGTNSNTNLTTTKTIDTADYVTLAINYLQANMSLNVTSNSTKPWRIYTDGMTHNDNGLLAWYQATFSPCMKVHDISSISSMQLSFRAESWQSIGSAADVIIDCVCIAKPDEWEAVARMAGITAESIDAVLANADILLGNLTSVTYMLSMCTGDFMLAAINNQTFLTALETSPYKDLVYANEHWAKFLAMVK